MKKSLSIAEIAERYGVTHRALRFYEDKELLRPERNGVHRHYGKRDEEILRLIIRGKSLGLSLEDIRAGLGPGKGGRTTLTVPRAILAERREAAEQERRVLERQIQEADALLAQGDCADVILSAN